MPSSNNQFDFLRQLSKVSLGSALGAVSKPHLVTCQSYLHPAHTFVPLNIEYPKSHQVQDFL
jgi:hypothetical protein